MNSKIVDWITSQIYKCRNFLCLNLFWTCCLRLLTWSTPGHLLSTVIILWFQTILFESYHFFLSTGMLISNYFSLIWFIVTGYTTPAPSSFPQGNEGELSPQSRLQPPGGYSSFGAGSDDPALVDKKKAAQQAYQEELKRQVFDLWNCFVQSGLEMKWEMLWLRVLNSGSWKPWVNICLFNPLSPNSDQHFISPNNITARSNVQIMRMNEMITKDEMSRCLNKFSQ